MREGNERQQTRKKDSASQEEKRTARKRGGQPLTRRPQLCATACTEVGTADAMDDVVFFGESTRAERDVIGRAYPAHIRSKEPLSDVELRVC